MRITIEVVDPTELFTGDKLVKILYHFDNQGQKGQYGAVTLPPNLKGNNEALSEDILKTIQHMLAEAWEKANPYFLKGD